MVRASAASVLLAGVLSGCGAERARAPADRVPAPAGTTRYADERRGFEVTFPSRWRRPRRAIRREVAGELAPRDGTTVLVSRPGAGEWVFLPVARGRARAVSGIARHFDPGARSSRRMPAVRGWAR